MQEVTEKTQGALSDKNAIRPYDKVKIKWLLGTHFAGVTGVEEEVHPSFAEKMVAAKKAEYADKSKNKKD